MKRTTLTRRLTRLILGIVFCIFILSSSFLGTIILLGYFNASESVSYLPEFHADEFKPHPNESDHFKIAGSGYVLCVGKNGSVTVKSNIGEVILSQFIYYSSCEGTNEKWGLDSISVELNSDTTVTITGKGSLNSIVNLLLTVSKEEPKLDVNIKTQYSVNSIVHREALVAIFDIPVSEVYLKNGGIDINSFASEYWLNRQGVRFGCDDRSALIYHTPGVSSLQLISEQRRLFINLEYYLDHPHIHIPFQEDAGGKWEDISAAAYNPGTERNNFFSIYFGSRSKVVPRVRLVPYGNLAGYVFTEHADGGNIRTHRAVYFGTEDIISSNNAKHGFVGHGIPTTKSVFYFNSDGLNSPSLPNDPLYLDFLDQLKETGLYDICLHSPEDQNSNREVLEEAIKFMKDRFDAATWIDHGFFSGKINRESFVADGLNQNSEFFVADLWEKYDTRFFWSPAVEKIQQSSIVNPKKELLQLRFKDGSVDFWRKYLSAEEIKDMGFFPAFIELLRRRYFYQEELNSLRPRKGSAFPTPLYWQHLTRTKYFYSWATYFTNGYPRLSTKKPEDQYSIEYKQLNKLLIDQGIFINHAYFVRNQPGYDVCTTLNGKIIINPYFDKILELMAGMRDSGDLYITTIKDLLHYWIITENLSFNYKPEGLVYVYNNNDEPINGLSLAVRADNVLVNGKIPNFRKVGEDMIIWFDIPARDYVKLQID